MGSHRVSTRVPSPEPVPPVDEPVDVTPYLHDAANYPGGHTPRVMRPRSERDVAALMRTEARLLAVGAQSSLTGGATPMGETVAALDRLTRIGDVHASRVTVQAGVPLHRLQAHVTAAGCHYPPVPTFTGAMAGGVVATNAAGAATFKYGSTRDWVQALTVVLPNGRVLDIERDAATAHPDGYFEITGDGGEVCRVPVPAYCMPDVAKRSAGYFARPGMDLIDLFIGAEGTLGIVTAVTFRLLPRIPRIGFLWVTLPDEARAVALVASLRDAARETWRKADPRGLDVPAIESLDRRSLDLVRADGSDRQLDMAIPADTATALIVQIELPDDPSCAPPVAHAQIADALTKSASDTPLTRLTRLLDRCGVLDRTEIAFPDDRRRQQQFLDLREAVPEAVNRRVRDARRQAPQVSKTAGDMIVPFERFGESLRAYRSAFERRGLDYAIWGHISDGNVHPNVIPRAHADVEAGQQAILECGRRIIALGGCPLAEHGVGRNIVKQALLRELYGAAGIDGMRRVKAALDPGWRLAPGVLFPGGDPPPGAS